MKRPGLSPCPSTPNCVATNDCLPGQKMDAWPYDHDEASTIQRLTTAIGQVPRMTIVEIHQKYIRATATSLIFRFVDDVEFLLDPETRTVRFRSCSRIGRFDLGKNRSRLELIKRLYFSRESP